MLNKQTINACHKNVTFYWKLLKYARGVQQSNQIMKDTFQRYFKSGNCPDSRLNKVDEDIL